MAGTAWKGLVAAAAAALAIAVGPISAGAAGAATTPATTTLSAAPDSNLRDGQTVTVTGAGYPANHTVDLVQCEQDVGCDFSNLALNTTDAAGGYTAPFTVRRILSLDGNSVDCVTRQDCILVSLDITDLSTGAQTAIAFDPNAPFKPPLHFRIVPDPNAHVNVAKGVVRLTGRVYCNQPVEIVGEFDLTQVYRRQIFHSSAFPDIPCAHSARFAIVFRPVDGLFDAGTAKLRIDGFGSTTSSYEQIKNVTLNLIPAAS